MTGHINVWTTKAGQQIPIAQLGDDHLRNIMRMLLRKSAVLREAEAVRMCLVADSGRFSELAVDAIEAEIRALEEVDCVDYLERYTPHWNGLVAEATRRFGRDAVAAFVAEHEPTQEDEQRAVALVLGTLARIDR